MDSIAQYFPIAQQKDSIPTSQAIASLGSLLPQLSLPQLRSVCGRMLSQQLLTPEGVRGLFSAVLGEEVTAGPGEAGKHD